MARVGALMRRHLRRPPPDPAPGLLEAGELRIDRERRQASVRGEPVDLTKQEFDLLSLLATRPGVVFTRAALLQ